jgi:uncharacterized membrane protein
MSQLIVVSFDDMEQAGQVLAALKKQQSQGNVKIEDAAVIVKDESGKVDVKNQASSGTKWGAFGGGVLGVLLTGLFFPVAGLVAGVAAGALIGKSLNLGVDKKFVQDVTEALKPGNSALFVIGSGNPAAVRATFEPFKGTVLQTTLDTDGLNTLKDALK